MVGMVARNIYELECLTVKNRNGIFYRCFATLLLVAMNTGCDFPNDASGAFHQAQAGHLRAGASINPPFVVESLPSPRGTEVDLLLKFANENDLIVAFEFGSESSLVGGIDKETARAPSALWRSAYFCVVGGKEPRHLYNEAAVWATRASTWYSPELGFSLFINLWPYSSALSISIGS